MSDSLGGSPSSTASENRVQALEAENERLKSEVKELREKLVALLRPAGAVISPLDIKDRRGEILRLVSEEKKTFVVMRKNVAMAKLSPVDQLHLDFESSDASTPSEIQVISPVDLKDRRGELLSLLAQGKRFLIVRHGKAVGMLVSPGDALPINVKNLTVVQLRQRHINV